MWRRLSPDTRGYRLNGWGRIRMEAHQRRDSLLVLGSEEP